MPEPDREHKQLSRALWLTLFALLLLLARYVLAPANDVLPPGEYRDAGLAALFNAERIRFDDGAGTPFQPDLRWYCATDALLLIIFAILFWSVIMRVGLRRAAMWARQLLRWPEQPPTSSCFLSPIVITESHALEAVPIDDVSETGGLSGSELLAGVRIIPVLDLVTPSRRPGAQMAVFRSQRAASVPKSEFDLRSKAILELFASEYSLAGLREAIETKLGLVPAGIKEWLREKYNWTSPRKNVGALADEEVRLSMEEVIPGYKFPFKDSKYFCSKLVTELLERTQLYHFDGHPETLSPTGLYVRLAKS